jgi:hypothetical protein
MTNDSNNPTDYINYFKDPKFNVWGTETSIRGPDIQKVLEVTLDYTIQNELTITYKKDSQLVYEILNNTCDDDFVTENLTVYIGEYTLFLPQKDFSNENWKI